MSGYVEGTYDVYREHITRARKQHKCSACGLPIMPGHLYMRVTWVFDRSAGGVKRCGACQKTHEHLRTLCGEVGEMWPDERLACGLDYAEEWEAEPPEYIARLPLLSDAERGALLAPEVSP